MLAAVGIGNGEISSIQSAKKPFQLLDLSLGTIYPLYLAFDLSLLADDCPVPFKTVNDFLCVLFPLHHYDKTAQPVPLQRTADEQADSAVRKCLMYYGPGNSPRLAIAARNRSMSMLEGRFTSSAISKNTVSLSERSRPEAKVAFDTWILKIGLQWIAEGSPLA
jgi:hypothetical protein